MKAAKAGGQDAAAQNAQDELNALLLFKNDMGVFLRLYSFLSQIFDYGSTAIEARSIFYRRLIPLLDFGREREGALAYPSGHVTVLMTVLGMVVLVWGARRWLVLAVAVFALLGAAGQALTYHYFTDTIGAALLGTSLVAIAARAAGLDRCQPTCDVDHSSG